MANVSERRQRNAEILCGAGGVEELTDDLHLQAERVVCRMYREKKVDLVNEFQDVLE